MTYRLETEVTTPKAAGYATQLGKHFGHKIPVETEGGETRIRFGFGLGLAIAEGDRLRLVAEAESDDDARKVAGILGSHLERFAFRENLSVAWPDTPTTGA